MTEKAATAIFYCPFLYRGCVNSFAIEFEGVFLKNRFYEVPKNGCGDGWI